MAAKGQGERSCGGPPSGCRRTRIYTVPEPRRDLGTPHPPAWHRNIPTQPPMGPRQSSLSTAISTVRRTGAQSTLGAPLSPQMTTAFTAESSRHLSSADCRLSSTGARGGMALGSATACPSGHIASPCSTAAPRLPHSPSGCRALTGGLRRVITPTPSSTSSSASHTPSLAMTPAAILHAHSAAHVRC